MPKRLGDGERRPGTGEARGEPNGLEAPPIGVRGDNGVGGNDGERAPLLPLSPMELSPVACSGLKPPEKSVPGCESLLTGGVAYDSSSGEKDSLT
jgi:hypothetical protein